MPTSAVYARHHLNDALAPQKTYGPSDGGLKLIVKNTFFDVDDSIPGMPGLQRAVTAPAVQSDLGDFQSDSDSEEDDHLPCIKEIGAPSSGEANSIASPELLRSLTTQSCATDIASPMYDQSRHGCPATPDHFEACYEFFPKPFAPNSYTCMGLPENLNMMPAAFLQPQVFEAQATCAPPQFNTQPFVGQQALMAYPQKFELHPFMGQQLAVMPSAGEEWQVLEKASQPFQPQTISHWRSRITGAARIVWTVDANKLKGNDRLTVSPLFKLSDGHPNAPPLPFKMIISPQVASDGKSSFRKAHGKAVIQLKCEAPRTDLESYPISFFLSIGTGRDEPHQRLQPRGPVTCNFAQSGICGLPKDSEVWDMLGIVEEKSRTFIVCLEVVTPQC